MRSKILLFLFSAVLAVGAVFGVANFCQSGRHSIRSADIRYV